MWFFCFSSSSCRPRQTSLGSGGGPTGAPGSFHTSDSTQASGAKPGAQVSKGGWRGRPRLKRWAADERRPVMPGPRGAELRSDAVARGAGRLAHGAGAPAHAVAVVSPWPSVRPAGVPPVPRWPPLAEKKPLWTLTGPSQLIHNLRSAATGPAEGGRCSDGAPATQQPTFLPAIQRVHVL